MFPDFAEMGGTIRTYDEATKVRVCERIERIAKDIAAAMECSVEVEITNKYPPVVNHPVETGHVKRLATKWFGPEHVSEDELPCLAAEDFSYFL